MVLNYLLKIKGRVMKSPSKGTVPNEPSHLLEMLNRHGFMCETSVICEPVMQIFIHRFWRHKCWKRPNILNHFSLYLFFFLFSFTHCPSWIIWVLWHHWGDCHSGMLHHKLQPLSNFRYLGEGRQWCPDRCHVSDGITDLGEYCHPALTDHQLPDCRRHRNILLLSSQQCRQGVQVLNNIDRAK